MTTKDDKELEMAKVFIRNLTKSVEENVKKYGGAECNANCDCGLEIQPLTATGNLGYKLGM